MSEYRRYHHGMTTLQHARKGEYFILAPDMRRPGKGHGVVFENLDRLLSPPRRVLRPVKGGFPDLKEKPKLHYDPAVGEPPQDLEGGLSGYWLVSERLKDVFEKVDPSSFAFVECDYRLQDGSPGPRLFLCDVVRVLDALDEQKSKLLIEVSDDFVGGKYYNFAGGISLVFRTEVVGEAHVFRTPYSGNYVICDSVMRSAVEAAGIAREDDSAGLWFEDAADY